MNGPKSELVNPMEEMATAETTVEMMGMAEIKAVTTEAITRTVAMLGTTEYT